MNSRNNTSFSQRPRLDSNDNGSDNGNIDIASAQGSEQVQDLLTQSPTPMYSPMQSASPPSSSPSLSCYQSPLESMDQLIMNHRSTEQQQVEGDRTRGRQGQHVLYQGHAHRNGQGRLHQGN